MPTLASMAEMAQRPRPWADVSALADMALLKLCRSQPVHLGAGASALPPTFRG